VRRSVFGHRLNGLLECDHGFSHLARIQPFERRAPANHLAKWIFMAGVMLRGRVRDESIPAARRRLNVAGPCGLIADGLANVGDGPRQRVLRDVHIGPESI
jgi:hypothetical protein